MNLLSLASHFPPHNYTQNDCLTAMKEAPFWNQLNDRSHRILDKVFTSNTGIEKRHFATDSRESVWQKSAQELNHYYESAAPKIGTAALQKALDQAHLTAQDLDVLLVSTCTGYLCPGLSTHLAEHIGAKQNIHTQDLTGHGCGAAIPLMQIAQGYTLTQPDAIIATLSVEVCSAAFYISDAPDVLISTCLFGDGASAALWSGKDRPHQTGYQTSNFHSLLLPEHREKVRFVNENGQLKNQLHKTVPQLTAKAAAQLYELSTQRSQPTKLITHGGGRDVVLALEESLNTPLPETNDVLKNYGNLSSPSVIIALEQHLKSDTPAENIWLATFGAGFSAHSCELKHS